MVAFGAVVAGKVIAEIGLVARLGLLATQVVRVRSTAIVATNN